MPTIALSPREDRHNLADEAHARLVASFVHWLRHTVGVTTHCEVPYNHYGHRGYIDVLAINQPSPELGWRAVACELKPDVHDLGETIRQVRKAQSYFRIPASILPHQDGLILAFPLVLEATEHNLITVLQYADVLDGIAVHFFHPQDAFANPIEQAWKKRARTATSVAGREPVRAIA